jgi:hypothetical protein
MIDYNAPLYQHPLQTWNAKKCEKLSKKKSPDAPFKGYLGSSASIPPAFGAIVYNGGCEREGKWYQGEFFPLPDIHKDFEIRVVPGWGWRIVKKS